MEMIEKSGVRLAGPTRLELATSGVTGRRSNQTELRPRQGDSNYNIKTAGIQPFSHLLKRRNPFLDRRVSAEQLVHLALEILERIHDIQMSRGFIGGLQRLPVSR